MRRYRFALIVLAALLAGVAGRAAAQSPGQSGCGRLILRSNAAGAFDTLCLGDAGASYAISPDGRWAATATVVGGLAQIGVIDIPSQSTGAATASTFLVPGDDIPFLDHLRFSPDSSRLAYVIESGANPRIGIRTLADSSLPVATLPVPAIESADGAPTNVEELLWTPDGSALTAVLASFSPKSPAFAIASLDPSGAQSPRFLLPPGGSCVYGISWSADGSTLAYAAAGLQNPCGDPSQDGVYALATASGVATRLTSLVALDAPSWTSDGRVLALVAQRDVPQSEQVALLGLDGTATFLNDPRPSACAALGGASSPQEAHGLLLYQSIDGSIVVDNLASGAQVLFSEAGPSSLHAPLLSPDGGSVAHIEVGGSGSSYQTLVRIDAVGGAEGAQATFAGLTVTLDRWLPDGSGLVARAQPGEHPLCPSGG